MQLDSQLRCLVSKCANYTRWRGHIFPFQSARSMTRGLRGSASFGSMPNNIAVVKLDFCNAFNRPHRDDMLRSVADRAPKLLR